MAEYEKTQQPWKLLESKEAVEKQAADNKDKVVVILFNVAEDPSRFGVERKLTGVRHKYQDSAVFFKCVVSKLSDQLATEFNIEEIPTIIFYRNGDKPKRLVKPEIEGVLAELDQLKPSKTS